MTADFHPDGSTSHGVRQSEGFPGVPQYAKAHAPIFHLHPGDKYRPTDMSTFLTHVRPQINFENVQPIQPNPTLANLDQWNIRGDKSGEDIYLTSVDDVVEEPSWLEGVTRVDGVGGMYCCRAGVIIVVERGEGVVDVFYFIFFAFNYGGRVLTKNLGNHVGDWEHVMIRFESGVPKKVWLSQHGNGEAYTFEALQKNVVGERPILYIATGSHAIYARIGDVDHTIPNFNTTIPFLLVDQCAAGPVVDPVLISYSYSYTPASERKDSVFSVKSATSWLKSNKPNSQDTSATGIFRALEPWVPHPGWLKYNGHWGDKEYEADDPRQQSLLGFRKYSDGPTGPAFKELARKNVWPANSFASGQILRISLDGSTRLRDQLKQWGWKCLGGSKAMKVKGNPRRIYVDGNVARDREETPNEESRASRAADLARRLLAPPQHGTV